MLKQIGLVVAGLVGLVNWACADVMAPDVLIRNTVQEVLTIVKQDKDIQAGNQKKILALVDAKVLPHFDFERMTRLAVGKPWRGATPEQKQALTAEFRAMLVRTYTKAFTVYRDQSVEIKPFNMAADASEATVKTIIKKQGAQPVSVDYQLSKVADGWKAFDISIEGVSMVGSYRGSFASEIQLGGIDGLIKTLAEKNSGTAGLADQAGIKK
jgi:phospholipid transport system substrate-binding protein